MALIPISIRGNWKVHELFFSRRKKVIIMMVQKPVCTFHYSVNVLSPFPVLKREKFTFNPQYCLFQTGPWGATAVCTFDFIVESLLFIYLLMFSCCFWEGATRQLFLPQFLLKSMKMGKDQKYDYLLQHITVDPHVIIFYGTLTIDIGDLSKSFFPWNNANLSK